MKPELHVISTGIQSVVDLVQIGAAIHPFIDAFHIREKQKSARELYEIVNLLKDEGVPLKKIVINDRIDVAMVTKVKGAQLATHSLDITDVKAFFPGLRIGCSVHTVGEAIYAEKYHADYVMFGHIFPSQSKPGLDPRGIEKLKEVTAMTRIPVIAIGGIHSENVDKVIEAEAQGIAVMSGVMMASDPVHAVKEYLVSLLKSDHSKEVMQNGRRI